jgi:hypothetical protein
MDEGPPHWYFPHLDALALDEPGLVLLYGWTSARARNGKPTRRREKENGKEIEIPHEQKFLLCQLADFAKRL